MKEPFENTYELQTNDPLQKTLKLTLVGNIKPLPEFVRLMSTVNIQHGEKIGEFNVWPTARPTFALERGKTITIALRIKHVGFGNVTLNLASGEPDSYKLKREPDGSYWLEMVIGPIKEPGAHATPVRLEASDGNKLAVDLTVNVPAENLVHTPRQLDMGEVALSDAKSGALRVGRLGVRKLAGEFRIKSLSSTLGFLKLEQQTIIDGSNYLIRIILNPDSLPKAGTYNGVVRIETDDNQLLEVPANITMVDR